MRSVLTLFLALLCALPASARELTVLVSRSAAGTELFLSAHAEDLFAMTATPRNVVPGGGGLVDMSGFARGTWEIGDALLARTDVAIGSAPARFEAMSFMLHSRTEAITLNTPLDALVAIELCSVVQQGQRQHWADLIGYVGYFSPSDARGMALTLKLPSDAPIEVTVIDADPKAQRRWQTTLAAGEPLTLPQARQAALWPLALLVFMVVAGAALWYRQAVAQAA